MSRENTTKRVQDKSFRERFRVPCLDGEFLGCITRLNKDQYRLYWMGCVRSPPSIHHKIFSQHMYESVCQATVCINTALELQAITTFYHGSDSELNHDIADKLLEIDDLLESGDAVTTEESNRSEDNLRET
eukprot:m.699724 g.699724  ORF g.699724 m.699724 type:complete len:131 (+) comp22906_c0_seq12:450-842(+)